MSFYSLHKPKKPIIIPMTPISIIIFIFIEKPKTKTKKKLKSFKFLSLTRRLTCLHMHDCCVRKREACLHTLSHSLTQTHPPLPISLFLSVIFLLYKLTPLFLHFVTHYYNSSFFYCCYFYFLGQGSLSNQPLKGDLF